MKTKLTILPILGALLVAAPLVSSWLAAQSQNNTGRPTVGPMAESQPRKIHLLHANTLSYDKNIDPDRQNLNGDVQFRQDSCYMYCDSAYFYERTNRMSAFGNVRLRQGDTLFVYCDSMYYDGDSLFGELYYNVHLQHISETTNTNLYTNYMTYNREAEEVEFPDYYPWGEFNGGVIIDSIVHLQSNLGWYFIQSKTALFIEDVEGRVYERNAQWKQNGSMPSTRRNPNDRQLTPEFYLYSDTLYYEFDNDLASVFGPSRILNDTATLYTSWGEFNTDSQQATLYEHSHIESPGRYATADTMFYDAKVGYGEAWGNILAIDTTDCIQVRGEYGYYMDNDSVPQMGFITGRALAMEYSNGDTLYLHADTLRAYTILNQIPADTLSHIEQLDTLGNTQLVIDSIIPAYTDTLRYMQAYYGVRYYRSDLQGVCDSLIYSAKDSLATFVGNPVMWNGQYQITGDTIFAVVDRGGIQRAMIHPNSFLTQSHDESLKVNMDTLTESEIRRLRIDTLHYDQISGTNLVCLFDSGHVRQLDMDGNIQIIYYPEESDHSMIGLNQMIGNFLSVWFKDQKMERLKIWPQVVGSLTPMHLITDDLLYQKGFRWMAYLRPKDPKDVFRGIEMKEEDKVEVVKLFDDEELNGW